MKLTIIIEEILHMVDKVKRKSNIGLILLCIIIFIVLIFIAGKCLYFNLILRPDNLFEDFYEYEKEYITIINIISDHKEEIEKIDSSYGKPFWFNDKGIYYFEEDYDINGDFKGYKDSYLEITDSQLSDIKTLLRHNSEINQVRLFENYILISGDFEYENRTKLAYSFRGNFKQSADDNRKHGYINKVKENWYVLFDR